MDELKIKSKIMTGIISKLIRVALQKKFGKNIDLKLNEVIASVNNGQVSIHLNADCRFEQSELTELLKGLD